MKQRAAYGLFFLSILLFIILLPRSRDEFRFSALQCSSEDFRQLREDRKEADADLLSAIRFDDTPLFYDARTSGWFYSISEESPDTDSRIRFSGKTGKVKLAFTGQIQPGKNIPMIAYTDTEYREYTLAVTTLPLIRIEFETEADPPEEKGVDQAVQLIMVDNRPSVRQRVIQSDGQLHLRGNGSSTYAKKAYRLTLYTKDGGKLKHENQTALLGLRNDGDWLLYPGYNDQEKIRNVFSANLWTESCGDDNTFGLKNGNEYRYVELFFNDQYWGLYALGYPIDAKQMDIHPNMLGEYDEFLFKQASWGPVIGKNDADGNGLVIQFEASDGDVDYGYSILSMYFNYLNAGAPNGLGHNDADNAIDIWLFLKLIQADDSVGQSRDQINNIFYTIKSTSEGNKILYTPWDMDRTWGNTVNMRAHNTTSAYALSPKYNRYDMRVSPIYAMQKHGLSINERIKNRYAELRADKWSDETIDGMLDAFERDIFGSGAYLREMVRWPDGSYIDPDLGLSLFREYVLTRFHSMDEYICKLSD